MTIDQSMCWRLAAIERTLRSFRDVLQMIVPDNAQAMIAEPARYEPLANDTVPE